MKSPAYNRRQYQQNRLVVLATAGGKCYIRGCLRPATTADHIVPLAAGGGNDLTNLRAACPHHNSVGGVAITNEIRRARKIGRRSRRW
jgi:5-methylcytosine-specific restriction endonuclease McrA